MFMRLPLTCSCIGAVFRCLNIPEGVRVRFSQLESPCASYSLDLRDFGTRCVLVNFEEPRSYSNINVVCPVSSAICRARAIMC